MLVPALSIQRRIGPETLEMSSLLVAQANATLEGATAIEALQEALAIDRELFGDEHPEARRASARRRTSRLCASISGACCR